MECRIPDRNPEPNPFFPSECSILGKIVDPFGLLRATHKRKEFHSFFRVGSRRSVLSNHLPRTFV